MLLLLYLGREVCTVQLIDEVLLPESNQPKGTGARVCWVLLRFLFLFVRRYSNADQGIGIGMEK